MDPKTRYLQERQNNKQQRTIHILEAAEYVFVQKGIEKATMQDIAKEANIGIATLFRYYPKKEKLIVAIATKLTEGIYETFRLIAGMPISSIDKIERLMDFFFSNIQDPDNSSIIFMEDFESRAAHFTEPLEDIEQFNELYRSIFNEFETIIQDGMTDGSIRSDIPISDTLTTVINVFGVFSRKLSLQNNILTFVSELPTDKQLLILKKILLEYIRAK